MKKALTAAIAIAIAHTATNQAANAQTPVNSNQSLTPPVIVDATGKTIGLEGDYGVIYHVNGLSLLLPVTKIVTRDSSGNLTSISSIDLQWGTNNVYYSTSDCSGSPLISQTGSIFRPSVLGRSGNTVTLYIASTQGATPQSVNSVYSNDGGCSTTFGSTWAYPIEYTIGLTQYAEPLHVK